MSFYLEVGLAGLGVPVIIIHFLLLIFCPTYSGPLEIVSSKHHAAKRGNMEIWYDLFRMPIVDHKVIIVQKVIILVIGNIISSLQQYILTTLLVLTGLGLTGSLYGTVMPMKKEIYLSQYQVAKKVIHYRQYQINSLCFGP